MSYTIIILKQDGSDYKPDFCKDTIPKQLNYEFDPKTDNKKLRPKILNLIYNYTHYRAGRLRLKHLFMPKYYSYTIKLWIGSKYDKTRKID